MVSTEHLPSPVRRLLFQPKSLASFQLELCLLWLMITLKNVSLTTWWQFMRSSILKIKWNAITPSNQGPFQDLRVHRPLDLSGNHKMILKLILSWVYFWNDKSKPWLADYENDNFKAAHAAVTSVWGVEPDLTREGGSIPGEKIDGSRFYEFYILLRRVRLY